MQVSHVNRQSDVNFKDAQTYILTRLRQELSPDLHYHCLEHTLDVLAVTEELCQLESIGRHDTMLLRTAALFHDSGFIYTRTEHESQGCDLAREVLPGFGYRPSEIKKICGMIMATRIPQTPKTHLEQIICDADLDYLGRDDFYTIGSTLLQELRAYNVINTEEEWNRIQVRFLSAHAYFTDTNIQRRTPKKNLYLEELTRLVATYDQ